MRLLVVRLTDTASLAPLPTRAHPQVKEHMERAILMVLGFSEDEKRRIEEQRTQATTQWLTKYLG